MENLWEGGNVRYHTFLANCLDLYIESRNFFAIVFSKSQWLLIRLPQSCALSKTRNMENLQRSRFVPFPTFVSVRKKFSACCSWIEEFFGVFFQLFSRIPPVRLRASALSKFHVMYNLGSSLGDPLLTSHTNFVGIQFVIRNCSTCVFSQSCFFPKTVIHFVAIQFHSKSRRYGNFAKRMAYPVSCVWFFWNELFGLVIVNPLVLGASFRKLFSEELLVRLPPSTVLLESSRLELLFNSCKVVFCEDCSSWKLHKSSDQIVDTVSHLRRKCMQRSVSSWFYENVRRDIFVSALNGLSYGKRLIYARRKCVPQMKNCC